MRVLGRLTLLLLAVLAVVLRPRRIQHRKKLCGVLVEGGLATLAAELHEAITHDTLHGVAHGTQLALVAHQAGRERVVLCLGFDDCSIKLRQVLARLLVQVLDARLAADPEEAVANHNVHSDVLVVLDERLTRHHAGLQRVVLELLRRDAFMHDLHVLGSVGLELLHAALAAELHLAAVGLENDGFPHGAELLAAHRARVQGVGLIRRSHRVLVGGLLVTRIL